jgi:hypothetical protein
MVCVCAVPAVTTGGVEACIEGSVVVAHARLAERIVAGHQVRETLCITVARGAIGGGRLDDAAIAEVITLTAFGKAVGHGVAIARATAEHARVGAEVGLDAQRIGGIDAGGDHADALSVPANVLRHLTFARGVGRSDPDEKAGITFKVVFAGAAIRRS